MYAGTYQCAGSNDTLVISVDANPGLLVTQFLINGTDAAKGFLAMGDQIRLTPSGLVSKGGARIGLRSVLTRKPIPEGAFYPRLYALKKKLDPYGLFYAPTAVGSEDWYVTDQI
ncbi:hypothetical protein GMDG_02551 [Pseudogymnoascus destructans 20631-21]|uniref:Beta-lactamase-like ARB-00930-like C-terminal domain-containing protein n=1 Tax=Pseudogymnoascus destructans (strain ATCC MYA-4855 / 20631-21) TaxID=658429 RepID=L8G613_PSED2|nr:hypothetical protein GMDG_02551 [Pseudogymnoascus destructans 20631-21]